MDIEEKRKRAEKICGDIGTRDKSLESDHPLYLSLLALRDVILTLADDENEAFTQLNVGSDWMRKFSLEDETKNFAMAIQYAQHPYDDIEAELERRGIKEKIIIGEIKVNKGQEVQYLKSLEDTIDEQTKLPLSFKVKQNNDGTVSITKYIEKPLHFLNRPLSQFAHEWMKRRVPANRKRVEELIKLASALSEKLGGLTSPPQTRTMGNVGEPLRRV